MASTDHKKEGVGITGDAIKGSTDDVKHLLSVSLVAYHSPRDELKQAIESLISAVQNARESGLPFADNDDSVILYLIDNSEKVIKPDEAVGRRESVSLKQSTIPKQNVRSKQIITKEVFTEFADLLKAAAIQPKLIAGHGNIGYGAGHNMAITRSSSRFHLILNPDVILHQTSLQHGLNYMLQNQQAVLLSPRAEDFQGNRQYLCKRYPSVLTLFLRGFIPAPIKSLFRKRLARYEMRELPDDRPTENIPIASGCFMLCRGDALRRINGFDPRYFLYFEDFDLSLRLGRTGRLVYLPAMRIKHAGGHTAGKGLKHITLFIRSALRFFNNHGWSIMHQRETSSATSQPKQ